MSLVDIYIPTEAGRDTVQVLGELGNIHFTDKNEGLSAFQRAFVNDIRRLDNAERQLAYLENVINKKGHLHIAHNPTLTLSRSSISNIDSLITDLNQIEQRVLELDTSFEALTKKYISLCEKSFVVTGSEVFFNLEDGVKIDTTEQDPLLLEQESLEAGIPLRNLKELTMNYIVGSIPRKNFSILHKILFRTLRGNLFIKNSPINEETFLNKSLNEERVEKDCFVVFTHGEVLLQKVCKIIESLDGIVFKDISADEEIREEMNNELKAKIDDISTVLDTTVQTLSTELFVVADQLETWKAIIRREKNCYITLNKFQENDRSLAAEGWVPTDEVELVKNTLKDADGTSSTVLHVIHTNRTPPTFHRVNKFTEAFQSIVDAYGIASYQEVNPGLATVVTFPFMFAIMFGDLGHGFILFLAALVLVLNENKLKYVRKDEIFDMAYSGRYILLLMGIFSMYTGLLYNDIFSKSMTLFKSGWKYPEEFKKNETVFATKTGVYPIGLDWAWHGAENALLFSNSYKMKLSILMGFAHMTYSLFFSLVNYRYRHSKLDVIANFIPSFLFMQSIFGYLSWAIVFKWSQDWIKLNKPAPGLLNMLINMFLSPFKIDVPLYRGQQFVQILLLATALVCAPFLLLAKPLYLRHKEKKNAVKYLSLDESREAETVHDDTTVGSSEFIVQDIETNEEPFNFGDVMIHQVIHTIEFCLNCVSHTASYLRLWALSLAHAQLSSVLWSMTIQNAFSSEDPGSFKSVAKVVILFGMWFVLTVCILVLMEGTSAMLHSLRLHWVEAMSKFFEGEGYAYEPFTFKNINEEVNGAAATA